jgi:DNA transformation protein
MAAKRERAPFVVNPLDPAREWVEEVLGRLPELSVRRLFGGAGVYAEDTIFGILYDQRLYLKTDDATRVAFIERGCHPLRARSGNVLTAYYEVPPEVLDDEDELLRWARLALEVAHRSASGEAPRRPEQARRKRRPAARAQRA